jgi:integrase
MKVKHTYQFLLDKERGKPDAKLRFRVKWNHNKNIVAFNVGYRVDVEKWSSDTQRCKINTTHGKSKTAAGAINSEIQRYEKAADDAFTEFEVNGVVPTADEFRTRFSVRIGRISEASAAGEKTLYERLSQFAEEVGRENQWTRRTYQKMETLKNHLLCFDKDLAFEKLNEKKLGDYVIHLRDVAGLRNRSAQKQLGTLKWFLRWASKKGYNSNRDFQGFSPKFKIEEKKVIFLDWDELMTVFNFEIPEEMQRLSHVRDVFCFCCFTGLRYSDVSNLKRSDVYSNHISVTTIKTTDSIKIELNDFSRKILEKYSGVEFKNNAALPVISNQKMNDAIKEIGKLCGIDKPVGITYYKGTKRVDEIYPKYALLSSHAGRRTFICNALTLGISPQIIMKWTGHSDYKSMKPYIDITDKAKEEAMCLFSEKNSPHS